MNILKLNFIGRFGEFLKTPFNLSREELKTFISFILWVVGLGLCLLIIAEGLK